MADILKEPEFKPAGWWPVDRLTLPYLAGAGFFLAMYHNRIPGAIPLLILHAAGIALVVLAVRAHPAPGSAAHGLQTLFRHWYPLPYVAVSFRVIAVIIPAARGVQFDAEMARLDLALWGVHPTVWLERIHTPWLTEFLQIAYSLFLLPILLVALILWRQRRFAAFRYYAFMIALGFLASFVGYLLVPVRGPRFMLASEQHFPLSGLWLFDWLQRGLDRLESAHFDCFPSGHTELTLLAWWCSRVISKELFGLFAVYSGVIVFATVYLRYHYTVDVVAGAALAAVLFAAGPYLYRAKG